MESLLITGAIFCLLIGFGYTLFSLGAGRVRPGMINLISALGGFILLTIDLYIRGRAQGTCPINSLFDVLVFVSWSILLISLIVGPAYHLSLLGAFTAPLVFLVLLYARLGPLGTAPVAASSRDPWVEFHAAVSLIAYGAFALAAVAGLMYWLQDFQLKNHKAGTLFYNLPPISDLGIANARLLRLGFLLLTAGFAAGFLSGMQIHNLKFAASALIWSCYGLILLLKRARRLPPRRTATASMVVFAFALLLLPAIQYLSSLK